MGYNVYIKYHK